MYPHLLRKAESRLARAGISKKPTPVYDQVPPPFAEGAVGSPPTKLRSGAKGRNAVPTGTDGGRLDIYSYAEFEKARAVADPACPPPMRSLGGGGGKAHVTQHRRPTPFGQGGAYNMPAREVESAVCSADSTYHPGEKFAAPARNLVRETAPDRGMYREACEYNRGRREELLSQAHPLVRGNGDILGHDGAFLVNKHMVEVKKVGDDEFPERRYRRNVRKAEAVKKWAARKADGHHMKNLLSQEHVGDRDNPSHYLFSVRH